MQKRELWKVIVFGIITIGIYDLVWLYKTRQEMVARGQKIPSFWLLFAPLVILLAVALMMFMSRFVLAGSSPEAGEGNAVIGLINALSVLLGVIALLVSIPITILWMYKYSQAVEAVTKGQTSLGFCFGLWLLLSFFSVSFIWPALIQDSFNKNT